MTTSTTANDMTPYRTTWGQWIKYYVTLNNHAGWPFFFWVRPKWYPSQMGDKKGTIVFITGGNSGTGYETAREYYLHGATVYIGCRSAQRANDAIEEIKKGGTRKITGQFEYIAPDPATVGTIEYLNLDLGDLDSVEKCANEFIEKVPKLDLYFANAGIMATDPGDHTTQGYPLQFGTNTLGHQRLTSLLLPLLQKTARAQPDNPPRFISLSSFGHSFTPSGGVNYELLEKRQELPKWPAYGESKWGNIALANYVHNHYGPGSSSKAAGDGEVLAFSVHPGMVATNLYQHVDGMDGGIQSKVFQSLIAISPPQGALNQLWCGEIPVDEARKLSGSFVSCFQTAIPYRPDLGNSAAVDKLWDWCAAQANKTK